MRFYFPQYKCYRSALELSAQVGFYSIVKLLLYRKAWTDEERGAALMRAAYDRKKYLVELLLGFDPPAKELHFGRICEFADVDLMTRFVELGVDPTKGDRFAEALFDMAAARPLLRFYRENNKKIKGLSEQINIALKLMIRKSRVQGCILLLWAGADLNASSPMDLRDRFPGYMDETALAKYNQENDIYITGFEALAYNGREKFFKQLKVEFPKDQIGLYLASATMFPERGLFFHLLAKTPKRLLNGGPRNSCEALESLVKMPCTYSYFNKERSLAVIKAIEALLKKGANWIPEERGLRHVASTMKNEDVDHVMAVLRLLHESEQSPELLGKLVIKAGVMRIIRDKDELLYFSILRKA